MSKRDIKIIAWCLLGAAIIAGIFADLRRTEIKADTADELAERNFQYVIALDKLQQTGTIQASVWLKGGSVPSEYKSVAEPGSLVIQLKGGVELIIPPNQNANQVRWVKRIGDKVIPCPNAECK